VVGKEKHFRKKPLLHREVATLFRRLCCEKVALRAAGSPRSLRKSSAQLSAVSHQLAISIQRLAGSQ
jgi:hypothetical protein